MRSHQQPTSDGVDDEHLGGVETEAAGGALPATPGTGATTTTTPTPLTPAVILRPTVRLIHALQKERGASCATVAASAVPSASSRASMEVGGDAAATAPEEREAQEAKRSVLSRKLSRARIETDSALSNLLGSIPLNGGGGTGTADWHRLEGSVSSVRKALIRLRSMTGGPPSTEPLLVGSSSEYKTPPSTNAETGAGGAFCGVAGVALQALGGFSAESSSPEGGAIAASRSSSEKRNGGGGSGGATFHRVYVAFNALIAHVVHDLVEGETRQILRGSHLSSPAAEGGESGEGESIVGAPPDDGRRLPRRSRCDSSPNRASLFGGGGGNRARASTTASCAEASAAAPPPPPPVASPASPASPRRSKRDHQRMPTQGGAGMSGRRRNRGSSRSLNDYSAILPSLRGVGGGGTASRRADPEGYDESPGCGGGEGRRTAALLSLLSSFVQLKESAGVERAFLTALLAAPHDSPLGGGGGGDDDRHSHHEMLFNNLVMEIEHSHSILRDVRRRAREAEACFDEYDELGTGGGRCRDAGRDELGRGSLLELVEEGVRPSPALENLQNLIRFNFALRAFRKAVTMERFWTLLTVYMDRLHSLELLIVEEVESSYQSSVILCNQRRQRAAAALHRDCLGAPTSPPRVVVGNANVDNTMVVSGTGYGCGGLPTSEGYDSALASVATNSQSRGTPNGGATCVDLAQLLAARNGSSAKRPGADGPTPPSAAHVRDVLRSMPPQQLKEALIALIGSGSPGGSIAESAPSSSRSVSVAMASEDAEFYLAQETDDYLKELPVDDQPEAMSPLPKEWQIDLYDVKFMRRVGRGAAGTTYLGKWRGETVAIKVATTSEIGVDGWSKEVESLQHLHHPNVIRLLGCINHPSPLTRCLVLEYCDSGDLATALLKQTPHNFFFRVAAGVSNGLTYLHSRKVLHRDVKPANVLLHGDVSGGNFTVKLTDFGVATEIKDGTRQEYTAETGTYRWMAPEVIRHEAYSSKADVYSFALLAWQLVSHEEPFAPYSQIEAAGKVALEIERPPFPDDTPGAIVHLIESCWDENPDARPTADDICSTLEGVRKGLSHEDKFWLSMPMGHQVYALTEVEEPVRKKHVSSGDFVRTGTGTKTPKRPSAGDVSSMESEAPKRPGKRMGSKHQSLRMRSARSMPLTPDRVREKKKKSFLGQFWKKKHDDGLQIDADMETTSVH